MSTAPTPPDRVPFPPSADRVEPMACPFCGAPPLLFSPSEDGEGFCVECEEWDNPLDCHLSIDRRTRTEAVAAWNRVASAVEKAKGGGPDAG